MNTNEKLAMERTRLANWRTFLAYIRTGLSFIALGAALFHFLKSPGWTIMGISSIILGILFLALSFVSYSFYNKKIRGIHKKHNNAGKTVTLSD